MTEGDDNFDTHVDDARAGLPFRAAAGDLDHVLQADSPLQAYSVSDDTGSSGGVASDLTHLKPEKASTMSVAA